MPSISQPGRVASDKNTKQEITDAVFTTGAAQDPADLKAAAVDWSSKSYSYFEGLNKTLDKGTTTIVVTVNGSGYFIGGRAVVTSYGDDVEAELEVDSTVTGAISLQSDDVTGTIGTRYDGSNVGSQLQLPGPVRFDSEIDLKIRNNGANNQRCGGGVHVLLD